MSKKIYIYFPVIGQHWKNFFHFSYHAFFLHGATFLSNLPLVLFVSFIGPWQLERTPGKPHLQLLTITTPSFPCSEKSYLAKNELDSIDFNEHEVMGPLTQAIQHMYDNDITPKEGDSMPAWMSALNAKLKDATAPRNVRLFILRLMMNTHKVRKLRIPTRLESYEYCTHKVKKL